MLIAAVNRSGESGRTRADTGSPPPNPLPNRDDPFEHGILLGALQLQEGLE